LECITWKKKLYLICGKRLLPHDTNTHVIIYGLLQAILHF